MGIQTPGGGVPPTRKIIAGDNVLIDGGTEGDLANDLVIAAPGTSPYPIRKAQATRTAALNSGAINGWRNVAFDTVEIDTGEPAWWDAAGAGFKPPAGVYLVTGRVRFNNVAATVIGVTRAGVMYRAMGPEMSANSRAVGGSCLVSVNGSQTIGLAVYTTVAGQAMTVASFDTYLQVIGPL
jgi:hypothetical protein